MKGRDIIIGCAALVGLLFGGAAPLTSAQNRPCAEEAKKFCQHIQPGDRQALTRCLKGHMNDLSAACKDRLQAAKARGKRLRDACAEDVRTFCSGIEPGGGRIAQCLKKHRDQLSSTCKTALAKARSTR